MELKPGYKQTDVGVIPEDWAVRRLDTLGSRNRPAIKAGPFGSALTKDIYTPHGYKVYGQEQVIRGDHRYGDYYVSRSKFEELKSCAVAPGDVLLSLVGTAGRSLVVPAHAAEGIINPRLIRLSFDKDLVHPEFFQAYLETDQFQALLARVTQGGTMGVLNAGSLRPLQIPLPPITEQRSISAALGALDTLLSVLEQLVAKKRDLKHAAMQQLLTGQRRLPGFHGEWLVKQLGDVLERVVGGGTPSRANPEYWGDGIPWVTVKDLSDFNPNQTQESVTKKGLQNSASHLIPKGTVITSTRMALGAAVRYEVAVCINQDLKALFPRPCISGHFLYHWFQYYGSAIAALGSGSTVKGIPLADLKRVEFLLAALPEQAAIAAVLSDMDAELAALEQRLAKTRALKQGMMQELLTGRTRLV
ncbi:MAG: restriction endonuclease subunit S [Gemmatimonadaceae bacterium]